MSVLSNEHFYNYTNSRKYQEPNKTKITPFEDMVYIQTYGEEPKKPQTSKPLSMDEILINGGWKK